MTTGLGPKASMPESSLRFVSGARSPSWVDSECLKQPARTHVPIAGQHRPMSPLLASTQPACIHVSIVDQNQPARTHLLQCWPAHTINTIMNNYAFAGMKIPRMLPQSWFFYKKGHAGRGPSVLIDRKPGIQDDEEKTEN